ncbi:hypothetical protein HERIO_870 [Hepatospora eriocheir]|uniref:Uncharacterized protein n=1 Tax=Hepatospora eriocheir TaxID=1081669 RepID=A0A1X0QC25_9MICR|nr:hypothetical protein HERIO_870 [Hepatospora eriocheir]
MVAKNMILIAKLQKLQLNYSIGCNDYYIDCKKHLRILFYSIGCKDYYIDRKILYKLSIKV